MRTTLVATVGKFNPPTIGHERLIKQLRLVAEPFDADIAMVLTRPTKAPAPELAPLSFEDRLRYCRIAFGADVTVEAPVANAMGLLRQYQGKYERIILVVGEDRLDMINRIRMYNGKEYHYDDIGYLNVARKDLVSSTLARETVAKGQYSEFLRLMPNALRPHSWELYMKLAKVLNPYLYQLNQNNVARIAG